MSSYVKSKLDSTSIVGSFTLGTTDAANLAAIKTATELIDNAIAGTEMQVDIVSAPAINLGTTDAANLASIKTTIDTLGAATAGAATDQIRVDIISAPALTIQDGGNTITVDGTVTANTGLTPLTDTQLRATAVPVSVATIPSHAVTNAGTFAVQESGAALTALQLIDNMISGNEAQVDVVAALPAGTNNIGVVTPYAGAANLVSGATASITDTTATQVIAAQGAGVVIYLTSLTVTNGDDDTGTFVNITDGSGGTVMWTGFAGIKGGGYTISFPAPLKFTANTAVYCACVTTGATVRGSAAGFKA